MTAWFLWFFLAPYLFLLDGLLAGLLPLRVDLGVAVCLIGALFVRTAAVPGYLLCAALGRALLQDGDLALHYLAMGLPVAALLPLRVLFFARAALVQVLGAGFLALTVPRLTALFADLSRQPADPSASGFAVVAATACGAPAAAWLLRRLPPFNLLVERQR